jgi:hypothetical protein
MSQQNSLLVGLIRKTNWRELNMTIQIQGKVERQVKTPVGEILNLKLEANEIFTGNAEKVMDWKNSLELILKHNNLPFKVSNLYGDGGAWCSHNPLNREIGCGFFWFDNENIAPVMSVLHEIGHWYDETTNFEHTELYFSELGTLGMETRAWEYAIDFGVLIGFDEWDAFKNFASFCLGSYFNDRFGTVAFRDLVRGFHGKAPTWEEAWNRIETKIAQVTGQRMSAFIEPAPEEDHFKVFLKRKQEARKQLKKHLGAKHWEV